MTQNSPYPWNTPNELRLTEADPLLYSAFLLDGSGTKDVRFSDLPAIHTYRDKRYKLWRRIMGKTKSRRSFKHLEEYDDAD